MSTINAFGQAPEMAVFVRVAELQSFSAAARELGLTTSGTSRVVGRLEARLGARLLHRTTRSVRLTSEGLAYMEECRNILAHIEQAEARVARELAAPAGLLRMHCGLAFGEQRLVPHLPEFLARFPKIQLDLTLADRVVDLVEAGGDLAVRIGDAGTSRLVAKHICDLERVVCASPAYLQRRGMPRTPQDLDEHDCLYVSSEPSLRRWPFRGPGGPVVVEASGRFSANNAKSVLDLAIEGVGIARLVDAVVADALRAGRLVRLFDSARQGDPVPLLALYPQNRRGLPKVAAMVDFLMEKFGTAPWRQVMRPRVNRGGRVRA